MRGKLYSTDTEHVAYFSMEIGTSKDIPTYSGGLGILAGDTLKSFADIGLPVVAVTLLNEKGYFHQRIDNDGNQIEEPVTWNKEDFLEKLPHTTEITIEGRQVKIAVWRHLLYGVSGYDVPIFYLDSNLEENSEYDRTLTSHLYGGDRQYRLCQEIILGIGGVKILEEMGYGHIKKYHMNEGHAALLTIELLEKTRWREGSDEASFNVAQVREKCVFTTHTPVAAGHDRFESELFHRLLGDYVPTFMLEKVTEEGKVNMTLIGLNMSSHVNGVAKRHQEVTKGMFPTFHIDAVTNGIHPETWATASFKKLFDKHIPNWRQDPFTLRHALSIPKREIWEAHMEAKKSLMNEINSRQNVDFHPERFTIGFARRFTAYKRPDMLVHDIERLKYIARKVGNIQVVYAGKAHAHDTQGKEIIKKICHIAKQINAENGPLKIVFLEHYDMRLGKMMVSGCDVWLNNPQRPFEASGTSGMKAALNGVPHFSTMDGWWLEGHVEGLTGWSIGPDPHTEGYYDDYDVIDEADDFYGKLEHVVVPIFYGNREEWTRIMQHAIAINASFFNTYRMVQQYIATAYV